MNFTVTNDQSLRERGNAQIWVLGIVLVVLVGGGIWLVNSAGPSDSNSSAKKASGHLSGPSVESNNKAPTESLATVELAPDFTLQSLEGSEITLSDYRGKKPVVLDFWASWCPNCQRDMPKLNSWYQDYGDDIEVIGVNMQEELGVVQGYVDRKRIDFPIVMDPAGVVSRAYGVRYTNYHVMIDKGGRVSKIVAGDVSEKEILALIDN